LPATSRLTTTNGFCVLDCTDIDFLLTEGFHLGKYSLSLLSSIFYIIQGQYRSELLSIEKAKEKNADFSYRDLAQVSLTGMLQLDFKMLFNKLLKL